MSTCPVKNCYSKGHHIIDVHEHFGSMVGISTDNYRNKATAFIKQTEITFEYSLDSELLQENMPGAGRIPLTILVNADDRVLEKLSGA